jgi:hypothetical protein
VALLYRFLKIKMPFNKGKKVKQTVTSRYYRENIPTKKNVMSFLNLYIRNALQKVELPFVCIPLFKLCNL